MDLPAGVISISTRSSEDFSASCRRPSSASSTASGVRLGVRRGLAAADERARAGVLADEAQAAAAAREELAHHLFEVLRVAAVKVSSNALA